MSNSTGQGPPVAGLLLLVLCLPVFILLATANSAGYRYGASDLAFYGPAVMRQLDPRLFPRDTPLIAAQARLTLMDESVAAAARVTRLDLPHLFLGLYLFTLILLAAAASAVGAQIFSSRWTLAAFLGAMTLRHAIPRSGTNTLEAYFHPRQLAFACGVAAVAAFLRGRPWGVGAGLVAAALLHPTTTLWFALWLSAAIFAGSRRHRSVIAAAAAAAALLVLVPAWFGAGPLAGRLVVMDREWLDTLAGKDYLFPLGWPLSAWLINLASVPLIWVIFRKRERAGLALTRERPLVIGCLSLVAVFFAVLIFNAARIALAIQLQPARIFWMLDFLAVVYAVWALAEWPGSSARRPRMAAAALAAASVLRGAYVMRAEFPDRPLFQTGVPGDWGRVSAWAGASTAPDTGWLADPGHASDYGTSFRLAAGRDVFVETVKDSAVGMYDRSIALRTRDRILEVGDFAALSADRARELARSHALDYLVTEHALPLPVVFEAGAIRVYSLR